MVDLCGRPSATKVRPLDVPETCTLRVGSPVFQVSFANIPKETVRFHWGAYNAVGQCQSADTEYKTSQYFVLCKYQCTNELFCGFRVLTPDWCLIPLDVPGTCTLRIGLLCGALRKHGTPKETRVAANKKAPKGRPRIRICVSAEFKTQACRTREAVQCVWRSCRIKLAGSACAAAVCWAARGHRRPALRRIPQWRRGGASKCCGPSWIGISAGNDSGILYARCAEATHFLGIGAGKDKRTDSGIVYARGEEATHFLSYALTIALHT